MKNLKILVCLIFVLFYGLTLNAIAFTAKETAGAGPYPYNFHIIDDHIYAGGHPLNPGNNVRNSDKQVLSTLEYLRSLGVKTVIDLENTKSIQERYDKLLRQVGLNRLHVPLNSSHMPDKREWAEILNAMRQPAYIHCKWGADRTGAVVGRYLVENHNFTSDQAYRSVISGGKYAGPLGGLKTGIFYKNLKNFIWSGPRLPL